MIFWELTFLIFMLVVMLSPDLDIFVFILCFFICMGVSNLLIDVLANYGVKPV